MDQENDGERHGRVEEHAGELQVHPEEERAKKANHNPGVARFYAFARGQPQEGVSIQKRGAMKLARLLVPENVIVHEGAKAEKAARRQFVDALWKHAAGSQEKRPAEQVLKEEPGDKVPSRAGER